MPSGSRIRVDYLDASAPAVSVKLQEVFGLAATPHLGSGRVPVTFKLLSPAQRPVQVTRDLASFWRGAYAHVRKDLRGRYPKHYWPEDPLQAQPCAACAAGARDGRPAYEARCSRRRTNSGSGPRLVCRAAGRSRC